LYWSVLKESTQMYTIYFSILAAKLLQIYSILSCSN